MIVIYHTGLLMPIGKGYENHDQAATALQALKEQNILSTQRLAIADLSELDIMRNKDTKSVIERPKRQRKGHTCPRKWMTFSQYREQQKRKRWEMV